MKKKKKRKKKHSQALQCTSLCGVVSMKAFLPPVYASKRHCCFVQNSTSVVNHALCLSWSSDNTKCVEMRGFLQLNLMNCTSKIWAKSLKCQARGNKEDERKSMLLLMERDFLPLTSCGKHGLETSNS